MYNTVRWRMNELRKPEDQPSIVRNSGSWMFPAGQVSNSHHTTQNLGANLRPDTLSIMVKDVYHTHQRRMNELRKSEDQPSIVRNSGSRVFPAGQVSNPHHTTQTLGANLRLDLSQKMVVRRRETASARFLFMNLFIQYNGLWISTTHFGEEWTSYANQKISRPS